MRIIITLAVVFATLGFAPLLHAAMYKYTDAQGEVHYTDDPPASADAHQVNLPGLGSYSSNISNNLPASKKKRSQGKGHYYKKLTLAHPQAKQTIHSAQGAVQVTAAIQPKLNLSRGDRLRVYLDGKKVPPGAIPSVSMQVKGINRGTHTVHVAVVDGKGKVLKRSDKVKFFVKHPSTITPANPAPGVRQNTP